MSDLFDKQVKFSRLIGKLLEWVYTQPDYAVTFGEAFRTSAQAMLNAKAGTGIKHSLHILRLAIDLQLFIKNVYQKDSSAYRKMGDYWKSLDPDCCWGGDFKTNPDGNHFSITHQGIK